SIPDRFPGMVRAAGVVRGCCEGRVEAGRALSRVAGVWWVDAGWRSYALAPDEVADAARAVLADGELAERCCRVGAGIRDLEAAARKPITLRKAEALLELLPKVGDVRVEVVGGEARLAGVGEAVRVLEAVKESGVSFDELAEKAGMEVEELKAFLGLLSPATAVKALAALLPTLEKNTRKNPQPPNTQHPTTQAGKNNHAGKGRILGRGTGEAQPSRRGKGRRRRGRVEEGEGG
ncbi:MAG: hypothetical protein ACTSUS_00310, partial [Candidatus Freyarchaeota archaeon]